MQLGSTPRGPKEIGCQVKGESGGGGKSEWHVSQGRRELKLKRLPGGTDVGGIKQIIRAHRMTKTSSEDSHDEVSQIKARGRKNCYVESDGVTLGSFRTGESVGS